MFQCANKQREDEEKEYKMKEEEEEKYKENLLLQQDSGTRALDLSMSVLLHFHTSERECQFGLTTKG